MPVLTSTGPHNDQGMPGAAVRPPSVDVAEVETKVAADPLPNRSSSINDIHGVDFRNFDYASSCRQAVNSEFDSVIHVSGGEWKKDADYFRVVSVVYGDVKGDAHTEAVVQTSCGIPANWDYEEIFVFAMSSGMPVELLAKLSPLDWGKGEEDNGSRYRISAINITNGQLDVSFSAGGSHACPAWTVTAKFGWNGRALSRAGQDRKPYVCRP